MNARKMGWVLVPALLLGGAGCVTPGKRTATGAARREQSLERALDAAPPLEAQGST